jgi:hypothetical protein
MSKTGEYFLKQALTVIKKVRNFFPTFPLVTKTLKRLPIFFDSVQSNKWSKV